MGLAHVQRREADAIAKALIQLLSLGPASTVIAQVTDPSVNSAVFHRGLLVVAVAYGFAYRLGSHVVANDSAGAVG